MLSNVPNDKFTGDYGDMWVACFNWVVTTDESNLMDWTGASQKAKWDQYLTTVVARHAVPDAVPIWF
jgi:hypothetical protein